MKTLLFPIINDMPWKLGKITRKILSLKVKVSEGLIDPLNLRLKPVIDNLIDITRSARLDELRHISLAIDGVSEILLEKVKSGVKKAKIAPYSDPLRLISMIKMDDLTECLKSCWSPILSVSGIVSINVLYSMALSFFDKPDRFKEDLKTIFPEVMGEYKIHERLVDEIERFKSKTLRIVSERGYVDIREIVVADSWEETVRRAALVNFLLDSGDLQLVKRKDKTVLVLGRRYSSKKDVWARVWVVRRKHGGVEIII